MNWKSAFSMVAILVAGTALSIWWEGNREPIRYEDCMLDIMKGQDGSMRGIAHIKCARVSRKELAIPSPGTVKWTVNDAFHTFSYPESREMRPTRGVFQFSSKKCAEAQEGDYLERRFTADAEGVFFEVFIPQAGEPADALATVGCMKTLSLTGVYR